MNTDTDQPLPERTCPECNHAFHATRRDQKYCTNRCASAAWRKRKGKLSGVDIDYENVEHVKPSVQPSPSPLPARRELVAPHQLGIAEEFIIQTLKTDNGELRTTVKEQAAKIEKLTSEKSELEKQVESLGRDLSEKPRGLSGVIQQNPSIIKDVATELPQVFNGILQVIREFRGGLPQLAGGGEAPAEVHPVLQKLASMPVELQQQVVAMLSSLLSIPDQKMLVDMIAYFNRSMMNVPKPKAV